MGGCCLFSLKFNMCSLWHKLISEKYSRLLSWILIYFSHCCPTASQKNPREVQPLLGCGQSEQTSCRSILYGSPNLSPNCNSRLLHYSTFHDGVRLWHFLLLLLKPESNCLCILFCIQNIMCVCYKVDHLFPYLRIISLR